MAELQLFCDGSSDPETGIGYGAYLLTDSDHITLPNLADTIHVKRFEPTNAARLELQTLLWALKEILPIQAKLTIFSDSQTICGLPARRQRLEQNNFCSQQGRPLNNADLYREFYALLPDDQIQFCKLKGHLRAEERTLNDQIFREVDKAARRALRQEMTKLKV